MERYSQESCINVVRVLTYLRVDAGRPSSMELVGGDGAGSACEKDDPQRRVHLVPLVNLMSINSFAESSSV